MYARVGARGVGFRGVGLIAECVFFLLLLRGWQTEEQGEKKIGEKILIINL